MTLILRQLPSRPPRSVGRLHASIGLDLALISKRLGRSSLSITADLYGHLLRSTGQRVAETVAHAIPRRGAHAHLTPTTITNEKGRLWVDQFAQVRDL